MKPKRDLVKVEATIKLLEANPRFVRGNRTGGIMMPISKELREAIQKSQTNQPDQDETTKK